MRLCYSEPGIEVFTFPLCVGESEIDALRLLLTDDELARADRFSFARDRNRFVVGRAQLRTSLAARLGVHPSENRFSYGPFGKPSLANERWAGSTGFNLSHSGDLAALAFTSRGNVGVDIEEVHQLSWTSEMAERVLSEREQAAFFARPESERIDAFLTSWTRKEAVMKALGSGLNRPLHTIEVSTAAELTAADRFPVIDGVERRDLAIATFLPGTGYVGAAAFEVAQGESVSRSARVTC